MAKVNVVFLTHDSYMKEGSCPICSYNLRQSPRKKRPHESDHSPSARGSDSENSEGAAAGGKKKPPFIRKVFTSSSECSATMASSSSTSETPATKIFTKQEPSTAAGPFEGDTFELTGLPLNRYVERQFAEIFQCNIWMDIPTEAEILSNCHHVYCEHCIQHWLRCNGVCPSCWELVEHDDVLPLRQQMLTMFNMLTLHCKYSENGCEEKRTVNGIDFQKGN